MSFMQSIYNKFGYQKSKQLINGMYQDQAITESEREAMLDEITAIEEAYLKRCRGVIVTMFQMPGNNLKTESKLLSASIFFIYFLIAFGVFYFLGITFIGARP